MKKTNVSLIIGIILISFVLLMALVSFVWTPYDANAMDMAHRFSGPSREHLLGSDMFGRDILSRTLVATRSAIAVSLFSVFSGAALGILIGSVAALSPSWLQIVIMRIIDAFMAFPGILSALLLSVIFGKGMINATIAIAIFMVPSFARLSYSMILENRNRGYIKAAKSYGCSNSRLVIHHMLPDMISRLVTQLSSAVGSAVLTESSLSFLGLGVTPPDASLGMMLAEARQHVLIHPYQAVVPGVVLLIAILGFNLFGDGMNEWFSSRRSS